jgi:hypothetical protein
MPHATTDPYAEEVEAYAIDPDLPVEEWGVVYLAGVPVPVLGDPDYVNLARYSPKISIGEADFDDLISTWKMEDWSGGGQIERMNVGSDTNRFRSATAETRFPRMLSNPPLTTQVTLSGASGDATPLADYNDLFWAAFGDKLRKWNTATEEFDGGATLAASPVGKGFSWGGLLWIPEGASGYETWDGASLTAGTAGITPIDFAEWDDKLIALEHDGQVSVWDGVGWSVQPPLKLKTEETPRHLVIWWDAEREPAIYVVTNRAVWVVDPLIPRLYRTGTKYPVHPDQGRGATAWRDDAMFVSTGIGVLRVNLGNVISPTGLDRGDSLPADLRGYITDMEPEYNSLIAVVQGFSEGDDFLDYPLEETLLQDAAVVLAQQQARSTVQRFTEAGWHTVWESSGADGVATRLVVSQASGEYRMWWGYDGDMYTQKMRRSLHTPKQGAQLAIDEFARTSYLMTPQFDAGMPGNAKSASHLDVVLHDAHTGRVGVQYRTDRDRAWRSLGSATVAGVTTSLMFDPDGDGWSEGEGHGWIQFLFSLDSETDDVTATPLIESITFKFVKVPLQAKSWVINVPLYHDEAWMGMGPHELATFIDALASTENFYPFKHRDETFRVRVAQTTGQQNLGPDMRERRIVNLLEVDAREATVLALGPMAAH